MPKKLTWLTLVALAGISLSACKILPTPSAQDGANASGFNPDKMVEDIWVAKVIPYLLQKAGPFAEVHGPSAMPRASRRPGWRC